MMISRFQAWKEIPLHLTFTRLDHISDNIGMQLIKDCEIYLIGTINIGYSIQLSAHTTNRKQDRGWM